MALGIDETSIILLGAIIAIVGAPLSLYLSRNDIFPMPPCALFLFTGFIIGFGGLWISFPFGGNPLGATLVILGILQATVGSALGTLYVRRRDGYSENPMLARIGRMQRTIRSFAEENEYDSPVRERVVEREVLLRQRVPLECSNCGAPINQEEIDWIGPETIRCLSCGHSIRVETERF